MHPADTCNSMHYDFMRNEYDRLPESIKLLYTYKEWQWLGTERERALERETMPDVAE